jgi:hypothetical protein
MRGLQPISKASGSALLQHFILKAIWRNSPNSGNPTLFETWRIFQFGGFILRDASWSLTQNASSIFQTLSNYLKMSLSFVMAGLDPAIHVFLAATLLRRGCPAQGRA